MTEPRPAGRGWDGHLAFVSIQAVAAIVTVISACVGIYLGFRGSDQEPNVQQEPNIQQEPNAPSEPKPVPQVLVEPKISGTWEGTYLCSQGRTGVVLEINQVESNVTAIFEMYRYGSDDTSPFGKSGYFNGIFNTETLHMSFPEGNWIEKPRSLIWKWTAFGFEGKFDQDLQTFSGRVNGRNCSDITLKRVESDH